MFVLTTYVIAREPGGQFAVRQWNSVVRGTATPAGTAKVASSLDAARLLVPAGLDNLGRHPDDDPAVVECWQ